MALVTKYSATVNKKGSIITLNNTTGSYDATTNPTGNGGGVNKPVSENAITEIYLKLKNNTYLLTLTSGSDFIPKNTLTRTLEPSDFSEIATESKFIDTLALIYVYEFYNVDGDSHSISTASGVSTITGVSSSYTNVLDGFGDTTRIKVKNSTQNQNYTINKSSSPAFSNTNIILEQEATEISNGAVNVYAGYLALATVVNFADFNACFDSKVANVKSVEKICSPDCDSKLVDEYMKLLLGSYAVYSMEDKELYTDAIDSIDALNAICKSTNCGC